ncbi:uncharacterized protein MELLADRAFT_101341 [Melampsora larici-populina 98AG31]|uniref:Uncharacterized protein n=1 Tax=Melampsora larici-populina (strain 98AG31 / pathotype 3-4-7) TaxID=747676 RepID=F4R4F5_MELLP|nr:uncharacterized protein MELLADRAFT_101341 [Melampsora larici-populina 98AG31]EGG13010.1 hypothetical protein MELLADRAFT_101341 [Melampsora larici-populina 98AG31]
MDSHNPHLQGFPPQPFQPMHQPNQQTNQPFDHRPFQPIDPAHQDLSHQTYQTRHQPHQGYQAQAHQDYQAQPHQHYQAQPHQHYQSQAHHQSQSETHQGHLPQTCQPHQARFHQSNQPLDPMHPDLSLQSFERDYEGFSQPTNHPALNQHCSTLNQPIRAFNLNQIEPHSQQVPPRLSLSDLPQNVHNSTSMNTIQTPSHRTLSQHTPSQATVPAGPDSQQNKSKSKKKSAVAAKDSTVSTRNVLNGFLPNTSYNHGLDLEAQGLSAEELMEKKSLDELRLSAEQVGKSLLSEDDEIHFRNLYEEMTKALAINCLGRGVRLSAVETYLPFTDIYFQTTCSCRGHKQAFREPTRWHGFTQTPESRAVYREHGGVKNGQAVKVLKSEYDKLTEEEKDRYKPKSKLEIIIERGEEEQAIDNNGDGGVSSQPGGGSDQGNDQSAIQMRKKSRSFVEDQGVVINWLKKVNSTMHRLAKTYHLEGFVMLVSTHIAHGSLQLIRATPGALKWHDATKRVNPEDNCVTNLQSYILGRKVGLVPDVSLKKDKSDKTEARQLLATRLFEFSNEKYTKWPWKNCVETLKGWGYEVTALPSACSQIEWITSQKGSNALTNSQARMILKDLRMDLIQLGRLTNSSVSTDSTPRKRLRPSSDVEVSEEE